MICNAPGTPSVLQMLVNVLRVLPGVGPKSAQRTVYHLMRYDCGGVAQLAQALLEATESIQHCSRCNIFIEQGICETCFGTRRDASVLCVVETSAGQMMIEQVLTHRGQYFMLMGRLSPLDNTGPKEIYFEHLLARATDLALSGPCTEVIFATNLTSEGEATAHYIGEMLKARGIKAARLARGVPVGGELEYTDTGITARAVLDRRQL